MHPIFDDDFVRGVRDTYHARMQAGAPHDEAREATLCEESLAPLPHTVSLVWIALAATQHELGHDDPLVRRCTAEAMDDERWLPLWADGDEPAARTLIASLRSWLQHPVADPVLVPLVPEYRRDQLKPTLESELIGIKKLLRSQPILANLGVLPTTEIVAAIASELEEYAAQRSTISDEMRKGVHRGLAVSFAAVLERDGWQWASAIDADGKASIALAAPDSSAWFSPFRLIGPRLDDPDTAANAVIALHEQLTGAARPAMPNAMFDLRPCVERLMDPDWPAKRAAVVSRTASADDPMTAMLKAFEALGAVSGNDMSPVTDALRVVAEQARELKRFIPDRSAAQPGEAAGVPPTAAAVARRALILLHELEHILTSVPAEALESLRAGWPDESKARFTPAMQRLCEARLAQLEVDGLAVDLSDAERRFLGTPIPDIPREAVVQFSWRAENLHCLLWALGIVDALKAYDDQSGPESVDFSLLADARAFVSTATLRAGDEIAAARDRAELWNWRARTRRLQDENRPFPAMPGREEASWDDVVRLTARKVAERGDPVPLLDEDLAAFGKAVRALGEEEARTVASIAQERQFALNWLCGHAPGNRWEATPTGT